MLGAIDSSRWPARERHLVSAGTASSERECQGLAVGIEPTWLAVSAREPARTSDSWTFARPFRSAFRDACTVNAYVPFCT